MGLVIDRLINVTAGHALSRGRDASSVTDGQGREIPAESVARFWHYVNKTESCWFWTRSVSRDGYGQVCVGRHPDGRQRKVYAHRLSYALVNGPIPAGAVIRHACDRPRCVNPQHLLLGTQAENIADAAVQGKYARPRPGRWTVPADVRTAAINASRRGEIADLARKTGYPVQQLAIIRLRARKAGQ